MPFNWKYLAWLDADMKFLNKQWASETILALKRDKAQYLQLFSHIHQMSPNKSQSLYVQESFAYRHVTLNNGLGGHPGFAWASSRWTLERTSGLIDEHILGSSDYLIALALVHKSHQKYLNRMSSVFVNVMKSFEEKCDKHLIKLSFINVKLFYSNFFLNLSTNFHSSRALCFTFGMGVKVTVIT